MLLFYFLSLQANDRAMSTKGVGFSVVEVRFFMKTASKGKHACVLEILSDKCQSSSATRMWCANLQRGDVASEDEARSEGQLQKC